MPFTDEQIKAFPAWLQKLVKMSPAAREAAGYSDEDIEQAARAFHLDKDYTQKSQKAAALEKIQEQYPDLSLEDAAKVWSWWQKNGDEVTTMWPHRSRIKEVVERPAPTPRADDRSNGAPLKRRWRDAEAADLYETARLREVFEDLESSSADLAVKRIREDWYQKEEIPRLDRVAGGYLDTAVAPIEFGRDPAHAALSISDVLKQAAAEGERDFRKVAKKMLESAGTVKKAGYDEGYQKG